MFESKHFDLIETDYDNNERDLTQSEWDTILCPSCDWTVKIVLDERCLPREEYNICNDMHKKYPNYSTGTSYFSMKFQMTRIEYFDKTSTLRDFIERIKSGPIYGYFEGLDKVESIESCDFYFIANGKKDVKMYEIQMGT